MGAVGLEPTYPKVPHFECGASTNSTTLPRLLKNNEPSNYNKNHFIDYAFSGKGRAVNISISSGQTLFDKNKQSYFFQSRKKNKKKN